MTSVATLKSVLNKSPYNDARPSFQTQSRGARLRLADELLVDFHSHRTRSIFLGRHDDDAPVTRAKIVDHIARVNCGELPHFIHN